MLMCSDPGYKLLEKLESDAALNSVVSAKEGLDDMRKLFSYLEVFGVLEKVCPSSHDQITQLTTV